MGWMLKYIGYDTHYFVLLILFIIAYGIFYIGIKENKQKRFLVYVLSSSFIIVVLWVLEYFEILSLSIYDSLLLSFSIYLAGSIVSKQKNEIITIFLTIIFIGAFIFYVPNISLAEIYGGDLTHLDNTLQKLPFIERVKEGYNILIQSLKNMTYYEDLDYPSGASKEKEKIRESVKKEIDDIVHLDISPSSISQKGDTKSIVSLSANNLLKDRYARNVYVGMDVGSEGRMYGLDVNSEEGFCYENNKNCYSAIDTIPPQGFAPALFEIMLPPCKNDFNAEIYTKYITTAIGEKVIFVDKGEYRDTISSEGPLTLDIELLPKRLTYPGEGDMKFIINIYSLLNSNQFENQHAYYKYLFLSIPKEINLERDSTYCPYQKYREEGGNTIYLFEIRDELQCFDKNTIGVLTCKAQIPEERVDEFIKGYKTFRVYVPYIFYGSFPYKIETISDKECENVFKKNTFGLSDVEFLNKRGYLISFRKTYNEKETINLEDLVSEMIDFCHNIFEGSFSDHECAYVVLKGYKGKLNIDSSRFSKSSKDKDKVVLQKDSSLDDILSNLEKIYGNEMEKDVEIINNYDGEGDLSIDVKYKFDCRGGKIVVIFE